MANSDFVDLTGLWRSQKAGSTTFSGTITADRWSEFAKRIDSLFQDEGAEKVKILFRENTNKKKPNHPDASVFAIKHDPNWAPANGGGEARRGFRR